MNKLLNSSENIVHHQKLKLQTNIIFLLRHHITDEQEAVISCVTNEKSEHRLHRKHCFCWDESKIMQVKISKTNNCPYMYVCTHLQSKDTNVQTCMYICIMSLLYGGVQHHQPNFSLYFLSISRHMTFGIHNTIPHSFYRLTSRLPSRT